MTDMEKTVTPPAPTYQGQTHIADVPALPHTPVDSSRLSPSYSSASVLEKGNVWDGYLEDDIPDKTQGWLIRNLRHQIFSLYRRLFGVIFVTNMAVFIATLVRDEANPSHLALIVVANLFCAILMRQDHVINTFFNVFCAVPSSYVGFVQL